MGMLFPFHLRFNRNLDLVSVGSSIAHRAQVTVGDNLLERFKVVRPFGVYSAEKAIKNQTRLTLFQHHETGLQLRGQVVHIESSDEFLLVGSLKVGSMADIESQGLNIGDFAPHDPVLDFVFLLNLSGGNNAEAQEEIDTLSLQNRIKSRLIEQSPNYTFLLGDDNLFAYQSRNLQVKLGTLGMSRPSLASVCPKESYIEVLKAFDNARKGEPITQVTLTLLGADGRAFDITGSLNPFSEPPMDAMVSGHFLSLEHGGQP